MRIAEIRFSPNDKTFQKEMKTIFWDLRWIEESNLELIDVDTALKYLAHAIKVLALLFIPITVSNCYECPFADIRQSAIYCGHMEKWIKAKEGNTIPDWCPFLKKEVQDDQR